MNKTIFLATVIFALTAFFSVHAQDGEGEEEKAVETKLGGHFGVVHPLVTVWDGGSSNLGDFYVVGFPTGVTIKKSDKFMFDIEFVPFVSEKSEVNLLFHPGVLFPMGNNFTFGTRAGFEIGSGAYGFSPLLNKAFPIPNCNSALFVELVVPVRFHSSGSNTTIALHVGVGF